MSSLLLLCLVPTADSLAALGSAKPKAVEAVGLWEGTLHFGAIELRIGFQITTKSDGSLAATMNSIDQGVKDIPVDTVTFAVMKLKLELNKAKAIFEGALTGDGKVIKGDWRQAGLTLPLELKRVEQFTELRRPQTPKGPFSYIVEEVFVDHKAADVKLAGTLTKPKGAGPFRCAILITGSGTQDRDESLFGHKPFHVLADHLTQAGIAVLRCDDRGAGKSTGDPAKATSADFATDVRAMIAFLKAREDIRAKGIGLIGHSEGSLIAGMVAAANPDVSFVVLLAGPGFSGEELLLMQGRAILKAMKADDQALAWQRATQSKLMKLAREGADGKTIREALDTALKEVPEAIRNKGGVIEAQLKQAETSLTTPWMRFFLAYDPRNDLKKVRCPVLALNGEKDTQVPPAENLQAIEKTLKEAGQADVTTRILPNLNHLFQSCKTGLPDEYGKIEETFSTEALRAISEWILKQQ